MEALFRSSRQLPTAQVASRTQMRRHPCPCCSDILLRHINSGQVYWRCSTCCQQMPVCENCKTYP